MCTIMVSFQIPTLISFFLENGIFIDNKLFSSFIYLGIDKLSAN